MIQEPSDASDRDREVDEIIRAYLEAVDAGQTLDRQEWLRRYPEFAAELEAFLTDYEHVDRLAEPLRPVVPPGAPVPSERVVSDNAETTGSGQPTGFSIGATIRYLGDYELVEEIARGGMGVVYKAHQVSLNRVVAVKMILAGLLATKADHDRFHSEAQAAALLDHPNILPIFEVGEHEGQHYFSMGYVDGQSLATRLAEGPLPPKEAAELVATVAEAVEYAHRQGVIHRDIKPSNILIDSKGRPRVTDFGLAKRVGAPGGNPLVGTGRGSDLTATGQVLGTPSYMAPEQAAGTINSVGPTADVYGLGALLYATLAGRPPFQAATPLETLQQVLEREPVALRQLNPGVPRDLETIVLKCLEKQMPRRYATAQALVDDLRRYLEGRPILARPVGRLEHAWRWCRRQPVVAGLSAAVAVTLVAGTIVSSIFAVKALEERDRANGNAELADKNAAEAMTNAGTAERKAKEAEEQKNRAAAGERLASERLAQVTAERQVAQSVESFLQYKLLAQADSRYQADALLWSGGSSAEAKENPTIREVLDRAAKELAPKRIDANFPNQPLVQAAILSTVGTTYRGVGEYELAIGFIERSAALYRQHLGPDHPDTLTSMDSLAGAYFTMQQLDKSIAMYEDTLKRRTRTLGRQHPQTLRTAANLCVNYEGAGRLIEALPLFEETLRLQKATLGPEHADTLYSMNNLAATYQSAGKRDLALPLFEETLKLRKAKLGADHPETLRSMGDLAEAYLEMQQFDKSIPLFEETLKRQQTKLGRQHPLTLATAESLGRSYTGAGRLVEALPLLEETLKLQKVKPGPEHSDTLNSMNYLASAYQDAGKLDLALPLLEESLKLRKAKFGPYDRNTLTNMNNLACAYWKAKQLDKSIPLFEETLKRQQIKLGRQHPLTLRTAANLGVNYKDAGRLVEALPLLEETLKLQKVTLGPEDPDTLFSMNRIADVYWVMQQFDKSIPMLEEMLKRQQTKLGRQHPLTLATAASLGRSYTGAGRLVEALPLLEEGYRAAKKYPALRWVGAALLEGYVRAEKTEQAAALAKELRADARTLLPVVSPQLAGQLDSKFVGLGQRSSWSPDGKKIAFGRSGNDHGILIHDIATHKTSEFTTAGRDPAWAGKDGRWIAYVSGASGSGPAEAVWVAEVPDGKPFRVAAGCMPSWSFGGKTLFFQAFNQNQMMATVITGNGQFSPPLVWSTVPYRYPAISPDGKRVAYESGGDLVIQQVEDGKVAKRFVLPKGNGMLGGWSPDSREFGFGGWNAADQMPCIILDVETSLARQVASRSLTFPAWSPDGTKITFDLRLSTGTEIWMMDAEAVKKVPTFKMEVR